ncbi:TPA: hypothetical protein TXL51_001774 [Streptococcus suis]|nr:hypothetical protein [Streptococcus suis]
MSKVSLFDITVPFWGEKEKKYFGVGQCEFDEERAAEVNANLQEYAAENGVDAVLVKVAEVGDNKNDSDDLTKLSKEALQEKLKELGVEYKTSDNKDKLIELLTAAKIQNEGE